jgi:guanylate kinase
MIDGGEFAEWAEVHGNLYGTSLRALREFQSRGIHVILDIDCQGARQLKERCADAVFVFILPPDLDELRRRLVGRNSDSAEVIERRMRVAVDEIQEATWYDYVIVNDAFDRAVERLKSIILSEQCRAGRVLASVSGMLHSCTLSKSS